MICTAITKFNIACLRHNGNTANESNVQILSQNFTGMSFVLCRVHKLLNTQHDNITQIITK